MDHCHLVRCIEDSSNFFVEKSHNEITIRQIQSRAHYKEPFKDEASYGRALANCVRWMLDQQYGVSEGYSRENYK